jgi:type IV pilus assembly protein PilP
MQKKRHIMGKHLRFICSIFLIVLWVGCESQAPPPPAPKVVRQKIGTSTGPAAKPKPAAAKKASPKKTAAAKSTAPATPSKPAPAKTAPTKSAQPAPAKTEPAKAAQSAPVAEKAETVKPAPVKAESKTPQTPTKPTVAEAPAPKSAASTAVAKNSTPADAGAKQSSVESGPPPVVSEKAAAAEDRPGRKGAAKMLVKLNPFEPLFSKEKPEVPQATAPRKEKKRRIPQTPLERVDLGQLKLTAIIRSPSGNKALVEVASGKGYIIKEGTYIGVHSGKVKKILKDRVVVEEEVENAIGEISIDQRELILQKPLGE